MRIVFARQARELLEGNISEGSVMTLLLTERLWIDTVAHQDIVGCR